MPYPIDRITYNKSRAYPVDHGYSLRRGVPSSIIVHSTEGTRGQSLESAANYLYHSALVSAHYLIGKAGEIIEFLAPVPYAAWHAGPAHTAYLNECSIGIECLHAKGETWLSAQKDALGWLIQQLVTDHAIAPTLIDTHGQVALPGPYDRKKDPTDWPHADFIAWRDQLFRASVPAVVIGLPVYQRSDHTGALWGHLTAGEHIVIDDLSNGHLQDGRGFVDLNGLDLR